MATSGEDVMKRWSWLMLLGLGAALARAHDPGLSTAQVRFLASTIEVTVGLAPGDAQQLLPPAARKQGKWTPADFVALQKPLNELAGRMWEARVAGAVLVPRATAVELAAGDNVSFRLVYDKPTAGRVKFQSCQLGRLPPGHREFVTCENATGALLARKLLSATNATIELELPREQPLGGATGNALPGPPTFWAFAALGIEHIWTGYDHLLFLFALLIVCRRFRSIVMIVSCFTLAHSITLAVATLGWIQLPSRLVEPAIAASIVFVGLENWLRRGAEPRGRWAVTFGFGLIHGFGFASVLHDLGVGQGGQGIAMPLFAFNLGVEVGQVSIAAVVLPLVWRLRKNDRFAAQGVPILSAIVAVAGAYWLFERVWPR